MQPPPNGLACDLDHTPPPFLRLLTGHAAPYHPEVYIPRVTRNSRDLRARCAARCSAPG
jgi:hypothetical protein